MNENHFYEKQYFHTLEYTSVRVIASTNKSNH